MLTHVAMARIFALLGLCITLYARATASAQPAGAARPVLSSMPKDNGAKPKRKRTVLDMRGKHYLSQRGLSHVCTNIKTHGMVKATSPRTMMRNRSASTNRVTPFGKLIQERSLVTKKGGTIKIPFVHPAAMLWVCCEESNEFKMFFSSVLEGQPQLRIAEYTDEVTQEGNSCRTTTKKIGSCTGPSWTSGRPPLQTKMHGSQG